MFRSAAEVSPADARGSRSALTTIFFLLPEGTQSRWHQVDSDEVWHLYEGGPLELLELNADGGSLTRIRLGPVSRGGDTPVHTVAAGKWQAARPVDGYVLAGCTVAPGFDFADFRLLADDPGTASAVRRAWPEAASFI